jgi:hypothetical protein
MNTNQQARVRERIIASITKKPDTGCWIWARQISNTGYGKITLSDESGTFMESAHRASYGAFIGPIPREGIVRQTCGDRLCVNPEHLELEINPN